MSSSSVVADGYDFRMRMLAVLQSEPRHLVRWASVFALIAAVMLPGRADAVGWQNGPSVIGPGMPGIRGALVQQELQQEEVERQRDLEEQRYQQKIQGMRLQHNLRTRRVERR